MPPIDKRALLEAAVALLTEELAALRESARQTREGATHEESRAENDKDTRGLEASYLARGQAQRVEETEEALALLRSVSLADFDADTPIDVGALVELDSDGEEQTYFLLPAGAGRKIEAGGRRVLLLSPASPLGEALLGKLEGDSFTLRLGGRTKELEILKIY